MTKICVFSDLHVFAHRFGGEIDPVTGMHSRLNDTLKVLDQTEAFCEEHSIPIRLFAGDMFHERGKLKPSTYNPVVDRYGPAREKTFIDIATVGNHDMEHRIAGQHALHGMRGPKTVILEGAGVEFFKIDDTYLYVGYVSYEPDIPSLKKHVEEVAKHVRELRKANKGKGETTGHKYRYILMVHHGVDGVIPGLPDCGFNASNLYADDFDFVFCGDYHTHKELVPGKAWMVGAPIQHNFGDAGQQRGFMVVDLETRAVERHKIKDVPEFCTLSIIDGKSSAVTPPDAPSLIEAIKGNFWRVRSDDEKKLEEMAASLTKGGAKAVWKEVVRDVKIAERIGSTLSMSTAQMFGTWLDKQADIIPDDKPALLALNEEILREAGVS